MKKLIVTFLIIGILTSCSSVKNSVAENTIQKINDDNFRKLNGIYKNSSSNPIAEFTSLWSTLNYDAKDYPNWKELKVEISIDEDDKELIVLSLLDDETIIANKIFKGKIDKNYYLFKKQTKAKMLVFILIWGIGNSSVKIGLSKQNELVVLEKNGGVGMIVVIPGFGSGSELIERKYERLSE